MPARVACSTRRTDAEGDLLATAKYLV